MRLITTCIGSYGGNQSPLIELTVQGDSSCINETITNLFVIVDENLIIELRNLVDELEDHNHKVNDRFNLIK